MKQSRVWLKWTASEDGGRRTVPIVGKYSTVVRFKDKQEDWLEEAWRIVLDIKQQVDARGEMIAFMRFLSPEGPVKLLYPENEFELFEGYRCVATGKILNG